MKKIEVMLFAIASELAGTGSIDVEVSLPITAGDLLLAIADEVPSLAPWIPSCRLAVERNFVNNEHVLTDLVEVALIPPVSGG